MLNKIKNMSKKGTSSEYEKFSMVNFFEDLKNVSLSMLPFVTILWLITTPWKVNSDTKTLISIYWSWFLAISVFYTISVAFKHNYSVWIRQLLLIFFSIVICLIAKLWFILSELNYDIISNNLANK